MRIGGSLLAATPRCPTDIAERFRGGISRPDHRWTLLFLGGIVMLTPLLFMFSTSLKYSPTSTT
jgi:drug/metabolite transporter (DMT)-like permease